MKTCYRCAKIIKGEAIMHVPPLYAVQLGADFERAYHPKCKEADEVDAAQELNAGERGAK